MFKVFLSCLTVINLYNEPLCALTIHTEIQFAIIEEEINQKIFTFKKLKKFDAS